MTNRKSHMGCLLPRRSITSDDVEVLKLWIRWKFCSISRVLGDTTRNMVVCHMAFQAFEWDHNAKCCRAHTLALGMLSYFSCSHVKPQIGVLQKVMSQTRTQTHAKWPIGNLPWAAWRQYFTIEPQFNVKIWLLFVHSKLMVVLSPRSDALFSNYMQ